MKAEQLFNWFMLGIVASLCFVFLASGCTTGAASGRMFDMSKVAEIKKGVTTKGDILTMFGEPFSKSQSSEGDYWMYFYTEGHFNRLDLVKSAYLGGTNTMTSMSRSLNVTFKGDVVDDYRTSETNM